MTEQLLYSLRFQWRIEFPSCWLNHSSQDLQYKSWCWVTHWEPEPVLSLHLLHSWRGSVGLWCLQQLLSWGVPGQVGVSVTCWEPALPVSVCSWEWWGSLETPSTSCHCTNQELSTGSWDSDDDTGRPSITNRNLINTVNNRRQYITMASHLAKIP